MGEAHPILAIIIADIAWKLLFDTHPSLYIGAIRETIGMDIPIAGGYTVGQIADIEEAHTLLNQHIEIIIFGVPES